MVFTLLAHAALARWMDPNAYGRYNFAINVAMLFAVLAHLGLDQAAMNFVPKYVAEGNTYLARAYFSFSLKIGLLVGGILCLLLAFGMPILAAASVPEAVAWWTLLLLPSAGLLFLQQTFRALKAFSFAQVFDQMLLPICLLLGAGVFHLLDRLSFESLTLWHVSLAMIGCIVLGNHAWHHMRPSSAQVLATPKTRGPHKQWLRVGLPLGIASLMSLLLARADLLILGMYRPADELASYAIAVRLSGVLILGLYAADMVVAPFISELYGRGDYGRLIKVYWFGALSSVLVSIPIALAFFAMPGKALSLFGSGFATASSPLLILVVARLVQTFFGPIGLLLTVTGHQDRYLVVITIVSLLQMVALVYCAEQFGSNGTAAVMCVGTVVWSAGLFMVATLRFPWFPFGLRRSS